MQPASSFDPTQVFVCGKLHVVRRRNFFAFVPKQKTPTIDRAEAYVTVMKEKFYLWVGNFKGTRLNG